MQFSLKQTTITFSILCSVMIWASPLGFVHASTGDSNLKGKKPPPVAKFAASFSTLRQSNPLKSAFYQKKLLAHKLHSALVNELHKIPTDTRALKERITALRPLLPKMQKNFVFRIIVDGQCTMCGSVGDLYWNLIGQGYTVDIVSSTVVNKEIALGIKPMQISKKDRELYKWRSLPVVLIGSRTTTKTINEISKNIKKVHFPVEMEDIETLIGQKNL